MATKTESINFHLPQYIKQRKFLMFKKALRCSTMEAAGLLGLFLGHALESNPTGELSEWDETILAELLGLEETRSKHVWEALLSTGWIELRDERVFVADWLKIAGPALHEKYRFTDRQLLSNIWALHKAVYGTKKEAHSESTVSSSEPHSELTVSSESEKKPTIPPVFGSPPRPSSKDKDEEPFLETWEAVSKNGPQRGEIPESERRDPKTRAPVQLLLDNFKQRFSEEKQGKPVTFLYAEWGYFIKKLLKDGFTPQEIDKRHAHWVMSTDSYIEDNRKSPGFFYKQFDRLEFGPITKESKDGRKPFNKGAATFTDEQEQRERELLRREQEALERDLSS